MKARIIVFIFLSTYGVIASAKLNPVILGQILHVQPTEIESIIKFLDHLQQAEDFTPILGWSNYHHVLPNIINKFNLKVGCEVGVASGSHSYKILKDTRVEILYSIDPYRFYGDSSNAGMPQIYFDVLYYKVKDRFSEFGTRSKLIRAMSSDAVRNFNKHSLDFVFLDANHTYDYVKQDLFLWYEKVKPGGIISGDDYATVHPGVPQAVNEFFAQRHLKINQDAHQPRVWWVQKPFDARD